MVKYLYKLKLCLIIVLFIFFDFITKFLATYYLEIRQIDFFSGFFYLHLFLNDWIAFSFYVPFLKILTIVIILLLVFYYIKYESFKKNKIIDLSFVLIISWALWNAWERVFLWRVTDFIWVKYFSVFNLADTYITLWMIIYFVLVVFKKDK